MTGGLEAGKSGKVVLYKAPDGRMSLDVRLEQDTVWLTQAQMAELFGRERSVITKHVNNVFGEGELAKKSNVQNLHIASSDKPVAAYSLDVIISVGYRVKSKRGVQFRQWATRVLREHSKRRLTSLLTLLNAGFGLLIFLNFSPSCTSRDWRRRTMRPSGKFGRRWSCARRRGAIGVTGGRARMRC